MQTKTIKVYDAIKDTYEEVDVVDKTDKEWKELLTKEQFHVTRQQGTERPFSGALLKNKKKGVYICIACQNHLFDSQTKFESGTGWPSFYEPIAKENIGTETDSSFFMTRTEIHCARCGAHLGHVFEDGPAPTGLRYCINSVSLDFIEKGEK